jgi:ATP-dependent DNA helicase RecG
MTSRPKGALSWVDAFRNILTMEESKGFDNKAVMGGLDRFIQIWTEDMVAHLGDGLKASGLLETPYSGLTGEERGKWVGKWRDLLGLDSPEGNSDAAESPKPKRARSSATSAPAKKPASGQALPPGGLTVDSPVDRLRGIDTKSAARFERLDVTTVRDLLYLFPRRHIDYSTIARISEVSPDEPCTVIGTVWESRAVKQGYKGKRVDTEAVLSDETGNIKVVWFGQRYLARTMKPNSRIAISGKASVFKGQLVFESPDYEFLDQGQTPIHTGRLVPVYPLTEGLTGRNVRRLAWQGLQEWLMGVEEFLPPDVLSQNHLMPLQQAIMQAHYPDNLAAWEEARRRLAFDELFTLQLAVLARRHHQANEVKGLPVQVDGPILEGFYESLPFSLTVAQRRCIDEILTDLQRGTPPMNRLLQGEVGSGKTVVALAALLAVAADGYQGAIMVPTEVLAEQHFQTIVRLLAGLARPVQEDNLTSVYLESLGRSVSVGLLTGSTRRPVKRKLTEMAAAGTLDLLIGTQALIQSGVSMPKLALAVADEQHRFGVMQRSALRQRGDETPHALIMSATPIPRTLSLTLFGDLDISNLDELPAGRQQVATRWLPPERRPAAYGFIRKEVESGRQCFVICPLVDESETIESKAAIAEHKRLSEDIFPELRVGLLHGRMSAKDKDKIMRQFREGELDILVSTAVVEVGIDVANATVMLIEGADRFGLAQLHQFRGRVGRGEHKSYCMLLSDSPSEGARERLAALEQIHDGFQLAEVDLELRGPGDFFGTRQSGLPNLRMAQLSDRKLLESARDEAARVREGDPELAAPEHAGLAAQVRRLMDRVSDEGS